MQVRNLLSWIRKMINQAPDPGAEDRAPQHSRIMKVKELLRKLEDLGGDELWLLTTLVGKGEEHACKQAAKESARNFKEWVRKAQDPACKDVKEKRLYGFIRKGEALPPPIAPCRRRCRQRRPGLL